MDGEIFLAVRENSLACRVIFSLDGQNNGNDRALTLNVAVVFLNAGKIISTQEEKLSIYSGRKVKIKARALAGW